MSSFQAETLQQFHADAALWTNFAEDHLERHPGLESYFGAKWNLVTHTAPGRCVCGIFGAASRAKFDRPTHAVHAVATEGQPADAEARADLFAEYPQRENFLLARRGGGKRLR